MKIIKYAKYHGGEDYSCLCVVIFKKIDQGGYCIYNESKNTYIEYTPETTLF